MSARNEVEALIRAAYEARKRGDLDVVVDHFAEAAHFSVAGSTAASPIPLMATGRAAIREVMRRLVEGFEFKNTEIVSLIVEDGHAAVRSRIHVRSTATGEEAETDLLDIVEVRDGKIQSFTQFADTALIARLAGA